MSVACRIVFRRPPSISSINLISLTYMAFLLLIVCAITFSLVRQVRRNRDATQRSSVGRDRMALVPPADGR